jgi:hypothetical protein
MVKICHVDDFFGLFPRFETIFVTFLVEKAQKGHGYGTSGKLYNLRDYHIHGLVFFSF